MLCGSRTVTNEEFKISLISESLKTSGLWSKINLDVHKYTSPLHQSIPEEVKHSSVFVYICTLKKR